MTELPEKDKKFEWMPACEGIEEMTADRSNISDA
jgi:hypothetical protein